VVRAACSANAARIGCRLQRAHCSSCRRASRCSALAQRFATGAGATRSPRSRRCTWCCCDAAYQPLRDIKVPPWVECIAHWHALIGTAAAVSGGVMAHTHARSATTNRSVTGHTVVCLFLAPPHRRVLQAPQRPPCRRRPPPQGQQPHGPCRRGGSDGGRAVAALAGPRSSAPKQRAAAGDERVSVARGPAPWHTPAPHCAQLCASAADGCALEQRCARWGGGGGGLGAGGCAARVQVLLQPPCHAHTPNTTTTAAPCTTRSDHAHLRRRRRQPPV
jgi:hypothetical protein